MHRSSTLTPADVTIQHGIRTTSPSRTLLDIAPCLTDAALMRAVNDGRLAGYLRFDALAGLPARSPGVPGAARLERLITGETPTRSRWEDSSKRFLRRSGLPMPAMNVWVEGYEVDAWFPDERLIVELDTTASAATAAHSRATASETRRCSPPAWTRSGSPGSG